MKKIKNLLRSFEIEENIIKTAVPAMEEYMNSILEWNKKVNLTAITSREEFIDKHLADSLMCAGSNEIQNSKTIIDVGTGAGFPGVPLALIFPEKSFLLLDSQNKKIEIIKEEAQKVGIRNAVFIQGRAEDLAGEEDYREKFDICVSRAVAPMAVLLEYCLPFVRTGGNFLAYKGAKWQQELYAAENALDILGGEKIRIDSSNFTKEDTDHVVIYIYKEKETPRKYPRKAGKPSKYPLL
ncbi:MAG TPA: 16S rRNA (guanine(527)-N(7))-methyltransferase RsmG [Bacillota bacterium]|nr:16S rRNA (guanine(527)-N(7))-methyltransferase RsmG [Bacillota bacterium]